MSDRKSKVSPTDTGDREIVFMLEEWGKWARQQSGLRLGYSVTGVFCARDRSVPPTPLIAETTALYIDSLVAELSIQYPKWADAICHRFVLRRKWHVIAKAMKCSKNMPSAWVKAGISEISAKAFP